MRLQWESDWAGGAAGLEPSGWDLSLQEQEAKAAGLHAGRRGDGQRGLEACTDSVSTQRWPDAHGGKEVMLAIFGEKLLHSPKYIKIS